MFQADYDIARDYYDPTRILPIAEFFINNEDKHSEEVVNKAREVKELCLFDWTSWAKSCFPDCWEDAREHFMLNDLADAFDELECLLEEEQLY